MSQIRTATMGAEPRTPGATLSGMGIAYGGPRLRCRPGLRRERGRPCIRRHAGRGAAEPGPSRQ